MIHRSGLIVFAKKPFPGQVKTRLQPEISPEVCLKIYRAFAEDTLEKITTLPGIQIWLGGFPNCDDPWFIEMAQKHNLRLFNQEGDNLGMRMERAFHLLNDDKIHLKVIIGTDSPHIPLSYIKLALDHLKTYPVVIGPSRDGGYYLLGISGVPPGIFNNISWSTDSVFKDTIQKLNEKKIPYRLLPEWFDVDHYDDLFTLHSHLSTLKKNGVSVPGRSWSALNSLEQFKKRKIHE